MLVRVTYGFFYSTETEEVLPAISVQRIEAYNVRAMNDRQHPAVDRHVSLHHLLYRLHSSRQTPL